MDQKTIKQLQILLREELRNFATKADLQSFATKDDLQNFATKDDLQSFATKADLIAMKNELIEEIKESEGFIVGSVDKNKADKQIVEELNKRVTRLERKIAS